MIVAGNVWLLTDLWALVGPKNIDTVPLHSHMKKTAKSQDHQGIKKFIIKSCPSPQNLMGKGQDKLSLTRYIA